MEDIKQIIDRILLAVNEAERIGISEDDKTICITRRLFYAISSNNAELSGLPPAYYYANRDVRFFGYQVKIVDDPDIAAYISIATIK